MSKAICSKIKLDNTDNDIAIEFNKCVNELLNLDDVKKLDDFSQHLNTSRLQHSINVSYYSYLICKRFKLDYKSAARAGLLHDLYLYDRHFERQEQSHTIYHPKAALKNAKRITDLNKVEEDAILKHMWPLCYGMPKYKEAFVVTFADKYCATAEIIKNINLSIKTKCINAKLKITKKCQ